MRAIASTIGALVAIAAIAIGAERAQAAGMITHAFMADEAIERVSDPDLRLLLTLHRHELLSGASYPDGGYFAGGYGEISHWERFVDAYVEYLRGRPGCGDLSDPLGPCAALVAHMLGTGAHGMGDEMWDWLFEPLVTDHGEVPDHPFAPPELGDVINNIEYAMDTIALADHFRWGESGFFLPPPSELTPVYDGANHGHTTEADILAGHAGGSAALAAERLGGVADSDRVRAQMPWSSAHMHDESGGVFDSADGIAGYYESLWAKLLDSTPPPPRVVAVHPEDGEEGVPFRFHPAKTSPGPHTGGGELRIIAVLSSAVDSSTVTEDSFELLGPGGAPVAVERGFVIPGHVRRGEHSGAALTPVPAEGGFPRPGPYGNGDGTHSIMFYPAVDLEPCTTYTAVLSREITDWAELPINTGQPLDRETRWSFTTRRAGPGPCPAADPPDPGPDPDPIHRCGGEIATIVGSRGDDVLKGTAGADVIVAFGGDDVVRGRGGDDLICAGGGDDNVRAGAGADTVRGKIGADTIRGGSGDDELRANGGADVVRGGADGDDLHGGAGGDELAAGAGDDSLRGKHDDDALRGGSGDDICRGGSGRDSARACEQVLGVP